MFLYDSWQGVGKELARSWQGVGKDEARLGKLKSLPRPC